RADGPLDELALSLSAVGEGTADFNLALVGAYSEDEAGERALMLRPSGRIGSADIDVLRPILVTESDGAITARGMLTANGGRVSFEGGYGEAGVDLRADWADMPLSLFEAGRGEARVSGRVHGSLAVSGAEALIGRAEARVVDARLVDAPPGGGVDGELSADLADGAMRLQALARDGAGLEARGGGRVPLALSARPFAASLPPDAPLDFTFAAAGPVDGLWSLAGSETLDVAGGVVADVRVAGTRNDPQVTGEIYVQDGRVEDSVVGLRLLDAAALVVFEGAQVRISDVDARDGHGGRIAGSGAVRLERADEPSGRIDIRLDRYRLADRDDARLSASGEASVVFAGGRPALAADMVVDEAAFAPVAGGGGAGSPRIAVVEINRPVDLDPPAPASAGPPLTVDAHVRADRRVFVRAAGLETEWGLDLTVAGAADAPDIRGTATLLRGDIDVAGNRFSFDEGRITFSGELDKARLDLVARQAAADLTAVVRVSGTVTAPVISLESTPSYPEDEILARVLFGRSAAELTALEAAQLAAALAQLARGGTGFTDVVRQGLGLDRLRVGGTSSSEPIVSGGKYVADGVYLELGARGEGGAEAAIEWEIRPRLELVSRFGGSQDAQIALRWRRDY
ncbi:MAG: translocation/assembly module TamB domain-containing protein, partial [Caulobacterales bacterium]|nr:translocation/assembly module TamB domain-containing protein [Caulobacterales bacterium]